MYEDFQDINDSYYTPLNPPKEGAAVPAIEKIMEQEYRQDSDDGEERRFDRILLDVGDATNEQVEAYIDDWYPREHCQHAYDCCAHWYMQYSSYDRAGKFVVVTLTYIQNI